MNKNTKSKQMESISTMLVELAEVKDDIKNAIISKGQTVGDNFREYAEAIEKISGGKEVPEILDTDPLTFVRLDSYEDAYISLENVNSPAEKPFEYNLNEGGWQTYTIGTKIKMNYADKLQFRSSTNVGMNGTLSENNHRQFKTDGGLFRCGGLLWSLTNFKQPTIIGSKHYGSFKGLFEGTNIVSTPIYNNFDISREWFADMFRNCVFLKEACDLPVNINAPYACSSMFSGCTALVNAPALPATTLPTSCYEYMFLDCSSLVNAPELPATTAVNRCYYYMFGHCTSLTEAPKLPADRVYLTSYQYMFEGCSNITEIYCNARWQDDLELELSNVICYSWLSGVPNEEDCIFHKNPEWAGPTTRGVNTIPSNWQIVDWEQDAA